MNVPREDWPLVFKLTEDLIPYATRHLTPYHYEVLSTLDNEKSHLYISTLCAYTTARLWAICQKRKMTPDYAYGTWGLPTEVNETNVTDIVFDIFEMRNSVINISYLQPTSAHVYSVVNVDGKVYLFESGLYMFSQRVLQFDKRYDLWKHIWSVKPYLVPGSPFYINKGFVPEDNILRKHFNCIKYSNRLNNKEWKCRKALLKDPCYIYTPTYIYK